MRPFRPLAVVVVGSVVAAGATLGLVLPAFAAGSSFSAHMETGNINGETREIEFGGTKPSGDSITDIIVNNPNIGEHVPAVERSVDPCDYGADKGTWDCWYAAPDGQQLDGDDNPATIEIFVTTAAGTHVTHFLNYDVGEETETPADTGYPDAALSFSPGKFTASVTPYSGDYAALEYGSQGEFGGGGTCPSDAEGEGIDFGPMIENGQTGSQSCTEPDTSSTAEFNTGDGGSVWSISTAQAQDFGEGEWGRTDNYDAQFSWVVLSAPTISSLTANADGSVLIKGNGGYTANDSGQSQATLKVYDENGDVACTIKVTADAWSCTTAALASGIHTFKAALTDEGAGYQDYFNDFPDDRSVIYVQGGVSAYSAAKSITLIAPVVAPLASPTPTPTPTPTETPLIWGFTINGIDPNHMTPGQHFTITGQGLPEGTTVDATIHSTPEDLGSTVVDSTGAFTLNATVPKDLPAGAHTIIVTASGPAITSGGSQQQGVKLLKVPSHRSQPTSPTVEVDATSPTAPNILTKGLQPFSDLAEHPGKIVSAVEIGLVLLLLAAFPAHLLESTIAEQSERFERRFKNRPKQPQWLERLVAWFKRAPLAGGIIVTTITAILFGFADPDFGFTLASLRLIVAAAIALFIVGFLANWLTGAIARAAWKIEAEIHTRPWGLILTVVGVILSRLLHFAPGFLIGLILGLAIEGRAARGYAWRLVVMRASIVVVFAILAWTGYSFLTLNGTEGGTFWSELLVETLVAITTEGIVALLVELLPLRFLEGERIYAKSRILWAVIYVVVVAIFVIAVVPWEGNWDALGSSIWFWIGALVLFALICIGVYVYFRRFAKPLEEEEGSEEVALGETVSGDRS